MNALGRRQKHREELRSLILEASRDIFVREGYEGFSMRKLAQQIEYAPGSIYLHFQSKEHLFRSLVDQSFAHLLDELKKLPSSGRRDWVKALKKGLRTYVEFGLRHPNEYRIAFLLRPTRGSGPYKPHPAFQVLRDMVRRCVQENVFGTLDVERTSQALWAAVHGVTSLLIQRPEFPWVEQGKLIEQVIDNAVESLRTPSVGAGKGGDNGHRNGR
jgi:AcrR family transcriptional regulator